MSQLEKFKEYFFDFPGVGLQIDLSKTGIHGEFTAGIEDRMQQAFLGILSIEKGEIMNPDEGRMVGHYWLRAPQLAPSQTLAEDIASVIQQIKGFAEAVHTGKITSEDGEVYEHVLVIGIGGSALGSEFVSTALGRGRDVMKLSFIDNTDPDGIDRVLEGLGEAIRRTLVVVISKSGGTIETRNGMEEVRAYFQKKELHFFRNAIAVTQRESKLDHMAVEQGWLQTFPLWDFIGGRMSVLSAVGLLPLALQGLDIDGLLSGAAACDKLTRIPVVRENPAALLAAVWYRLCEGKGGTQMVIVPYKDRLCYFAKYLQQLVMESLGKEKDLDGVVVNQGIAVFGNKGTTDQHSYMQQLLEGPTNSFVTFVEVLKDRSGASVEVGEGSTSGDYLSAYLLGTREALSAAGRPNLTLTIEEVSAFSVGGLIALYERAVSIYALLIHINAYHQPAVESGKKTATHVIDVKNQVLNFLRNSDKTYTVEALADELDIKDEEREILFKILQHLAANRQNGIEKVEAENILKIGYRFSPQRMQKAEGE